MNKWLNNLETLAKTGNVGNCPFCGSNNTDYNSTKVSGDYGFAILWCNECMQSYIISRLKITNDMKTDQPIPDSLGYKI